MNSNDIQIIEESGFLSQLQEVLGRSNLKIYTIREMKELVQRYDKFEYENEIEFIQLCGKLWSFVKFCMLHQNTTFCLIDDIVPNLKIHCPDSNLLIETININSL